MPDTPVAVNLQKLNLQHGSKINEPTSDYKPSWQDLAHRLITPIESDPETETFQQYHFQLSEQQKVPIKRRPGFYCKGPEDATKGKRNVTHTEILALDFDRVDPNWREALDAELEDWAHVWHSTCSHKPEHPKVRIVLPLKEQLSEDEYGALVLAMFERLNMGWLGYGESKNPGQVMFLPIKLAGGVFEFNAEMDKPAVDGRAILREHFQGAVPHKTFQGRIPEPHELWNSVPLEFRKSKNTDFEKLSATERKQRASRHIQRLGIHSSQLEIRAFCMWRSYEQLLTPGPDGLLADFYQKSVHDTRYRYVDCSADSANGLAIYGQGDEEHPMFPGESTQAFSWHMGSDPAAGRQLNTFDHVLILVYENDKQKFIKWIRKQPEIVELMESMAFKAYNLGLATDELDTRFFVNGRPHPPISDFDAVANVLPPTSHAAQITKMLPRKDPETLAFSQTALSRVINHSRELNDIGIDSFTGEVVALEPLAFNLHTVDEVHPQPGQVVTPMVLMHLERYFGANMGDSKKKTQSLQTMAYRSPPASLSTPLWVEQQGQWDGQARIDTVLEWFFCPDCSLELTRFLSRKWFQAMAMRLRYPGIDWQYVLRVVGERGDEGKTAFFHSITPRINEITQARVISWDDFCNEKTRFEKCRGQTMVLIDEEGGADKVSESKKKAAISSRSDNGRYPYYQFEIERERPYLLATTSNDRHLLDDYTVSDEKRYWPVMATSQRTKPQIADFCRQLEAVLPQLVLEGLATLGADETTRRENLFLFPDDMETALTKQRDRFLSIGKDYAVHSAELAIDDLLRSGKGVGGLTSRQIFNEMYRDARPDYGSDNSDYSLDPVGKEMYKHQIKTIKDAIRMKGGRTIIGKNGRAQRQRYGIKLETAYHFNAMIAESSS